MIAGETHEIPAQPRRYSEHSAEAVDEAVHELILGAEQQALGVIHQHRTKLITLIAALEEKETLNREDVEKCLGPARSSGGGTTVPEG